MSKEIWQDVMSNPQAQYPREDFVRFVKRTYPTPAKFLDLGCGAGANAYFLVNEGHKVDAIDWIIEYPQNPDNSPNFVCADLTTTPYPESEYDCVLDNTTLCHIEQAKDVIKSCHFAMKEGGKIFSIWPTNWNHPDSFTGKGYVWHMAREEIADYFQGFKLDVGRLSYTDFPRRRSLTYWIIIGTK